MNRVLGDLALVRDMSERLKSLLDKIDPLKDVTLGRLTTDEPVLRESALSHDLGETWVDDWERGEGHPLLRDLGEEFTKGG